MARPTLRVLCFGDSLTAGHHGCGAAYHPYAEKLAQMISMALPHIDIDAVEDGKPGDMVRGGFCERLKQACASVRARAGGQGAGRRGRGAALTLRSVCSAHSQEDGDAVRLDHRARGDKVSRRYRSPFPPLPGHAGRG